MSKPENPSTGGSKSATFDSLNADLIVVEGNEDTTVRPIPPSLRASHAAYRKLLADRGRSSSEPPSEPPHSNGA